MTKYNRFPLVLTEPEVSRIREAVKSGRSVTLTLAKHRHRVNSPHSVLLTNGEMARLNDGLTHKVTLPHSRLTKHGGFLPFLIPILAGLASAAGIAGGVSAAVKNAKEARAADAAKKLVEKKLASGRGLLGTNCSGVAPKYLSECRRNFVPKVR